MLCNGCITLSITVITGVTIALESKAYERDIIAVIRELASSSGYLLTIVYCPAVLQARIDAGTSLEARYADEFITDSARSGTRDVGGRLKKYSNGIRGEKRVGKAVLQR